MREMLKKADLLGFAIIAAAVVSWSVRSVWTPYQTIAAILGGVLLLSSIVIKSDEIRAGLSRRSTRFGINSAASAVFIIGILAIVNYLGVQHVKRVDMTKEKLNSLSDQSSAVADQVKEDVKIKAFYQSGEYAPVKDILEKFSARNKKLSYEFINPDKQPQAAKQYNVTQYGGFPNLQTGEVIPFGTLILEGNGKIERIEKQSEPVLEEDITNALVKIVKGEKKTIYFTVGHGEKQIDSAERDGYQVAGKKLELENYVVKSVNLAERKIPDDASVVIIAGPTNQPLAEQVDVIDAYLKAGGSVLLLLEPPPAPSFEDFAKTWSIKVGNDFVTDPTRFVRNLGPTSPVPNSYSEHKIMERFKFITFFPTVRSVTPDTPPVEGLTVDRLVITSENSWSETDMKADGTTFNEKTGMKGAKSLAVAASKDLDEKKKVRLVVFGDSDFASNQYFASEANGNLFLNTVSWLAQEESFISIRPKNPEDRRLTMTESEGRLVSYFMLLFLPGGVLLAGISIWMKRKK